MEFLQVVKAQQMHFCYCNWEMKYFSLLDKYKHQNSKPIVIHLQHLKIKSLLKMFPDFPYSLQSTDSDSTCVVKPCSRWMHCSSVSIM